MKKIYLYLTLSLFLFLETGLYSQVAVNSTGASPHASAMFDISSTSKGLLIPRMTDTEMHFIASPASGLLVYNTTNQALYNYNSGSWSMVKAKTPSLLMDADGNTSVDVEYSANNDEIHFRLGGSTRMILKNNRLELLNSATSVYIGVNAGQAGLYANNNVGIGESSLMSNITGFNNVAIGHLALLSNNNSFNTAVGAQSLRYNYDGVGNTAIGAFALLQNQNGDNNTAGGSHALYLNTSNDNTAFGNNALYTNSDGYNNTAVGSSAMYYNLSGYNNAALGFSAMRNNLTGYNNTAVGVSAMIYSYDGINNTAVGYVALANTYSGDENTAAGVAALYTNVSGSNNAAFGREALRDNTSNDNTAVGYHAAMVTASGIQNVAVGSNSLVNNTTGSYHTAVGYNTGPSTTNLANTTTVGTDARATATDMVRIGNGYVNSIGGQVGWTTMSDGRFKENVREDVPGLSFINELRPVTYEVNRGKFNEFAGLSNSSLASDPAYSTRQMTEKTTGFIAQEVEASAKSMGFYFSGVDAPDNPDDYYGLRYAEFVVPLVMAVQELSSQNAQQQQMIEELTDRNRELEGKVEALEAVFSPQQAP